MAFVGLRRAALGLLPSSLFIAGLLLSLAAAPAALAASSAEEATVVRELIEQRDAYSTTYLLSNGAKRVVFSQAPVHYQDADGDWRTIDASFVADKDGTYVTKAAAVEVVVGAQTEKRAPVTVRRGKYEVSLDLVMASEVQPSVADTEATFSDVAEQTDLIYEATGDGLKETLVLASASAPSSFTFRLLHEGLELRRDDVDGWALYAAGESEPVLLLGQLLVWDSSVDESDVPAYCDEARMQVLSGEGSSNIVYHIPDEWLAAKERVYPVYVDPSLFTRAPDDCYISYGQPNSGHNTQDLFVGKVSTDVSLCKTLVKYPQVNYGANIASDAHISSATFSVRQYWQASSGKAVNCYRVTNDSTAWGESATWNSVTINETAGRTKTPTASACWLDFDCQSDVQGWIRNDYANKGFVLTAGSWDSSYAHKLRSSEYSDADYRPTLTVDYESPTASSATDPPGTPSYRIGDTATVKVTPSVAVPSQLTEIRMGVNRVTASGADEPIDSRRGVFAWFASPPASPWVYQATANGGYFAYYNSNDYGIDHVVPLLSQCSIAANHSYATFKFQIDNDFGDKQDNDFDTYLAMSSGSGNSWSGVWRDDASNAVDILPRPVTSAAATSTPSDGYFVNHDTNNDGSAYAASGEPDAKNNENGQGRGDITLTWSASPLADGYRIYLWDGVQFRHIDSVSGGASTSWSSVDKQIFPSDSTLEGWADNGRTTSPFLLGNGLNLRDDPNRLYLKMSGGLSDAWHYYRFQVCPYSEIGVVTSGCNNADHTLLSRSIVVPNDPQHTAHSLGEWNGHAASAELDSGSLRLSTTDLAIATFGPAAVLERSYCSGVTAATRFAPGWRFAFDASLAISANQITYADAEGIEHLFTKAGSGWQAPNGYFATLAAAGSDWTLTFPDASVLRFNSAGILTKESDANGNETTYAWSSGDLTISAANGQTIVVDCNASGQVVSATYSTAAGTRVVSYATAAPWEVTYFPGQDEERTISYTYSSNLLTHITQHDWPTPNNDVAEQFLYTDGALTEVRFADYATVTDAKATIDYTIVAPNQVPTQAAVTRYGTVDGQAGSPTQGVAYEWKLQTATVLVEAVTDEQGEPETATTYQYDTNLNIVEEVCVDDEEDLLYEIDSEYDEDGNLIESVEDLGGGEELTTTATYASGNDQPDEITVSDGDGGNGTEASIDNDYDANNNLTSSEEELIDGGAVARTEYSYQDVTVGTTTLKKARISEKVKIAADPVSWAETTYADFAANGEPQTIVHKSVVRSYGGSASDLTETATYDAFGNLTAKTDTSGATTETNTYDLAGRKLTSTDASGVITHYVYDLMGNQIESWRSVAGSAIKADWSKSYQGSAPNFTDYGFDAAGRETKSWTYLHDGSSATLQKTATTTYDGLGNPVSASDTTIGGQDEKWLYDAQGRITSHWALGVAGYDVNRATRTSYDEQGRVLTETQPGDSEPTTYAYDLAGNITTQTNPDGSQVFSTYDAEGNLTQKQETLEGYDPNSNPTAVAITTYLYNEADQLTRETKPSGLQTDYGYDLAGRQISIGSSILAYNTMGWTLREADGDGIVTKKSYDTAGRIEAELTSDESSDSRLTDYDYNALGQVTDQIEKDAAPTPDVAISTLHTGYDLFGRTIEVKHTTTAGVVKETDYTVDSLGRITSSEETAASGVAHTIDYPANQATGTETTLAYDDGATPDTEVTITNDAREKEASRAAAIANLGTITRTITARDSAERWTAATLTGSLGFARSFNGAGQLTGQSGAGFSSAGSYTYDPDSGRKSSQSLPLAYGGTISASYGYDATGRLESSYLGGLTATSFDSAGNLTAFTDSGGSASLTYGSGNRLTEMTYAGATTEFAYDAATGWRTQQGPSADPDQITYGYLPSGRLVSYANADTGISATYAYDAAGQRIESVVDDGSVTTTTAFTYDGLLLLSLEATSDEPDSWRIDYLYDEEGRPYAGSYRSPADSTDPTLFVIITTDRGDVVELLDEDGVAFAAYRYDEWGNPLSSSTQSTNNISAQLAAQVAERQILRYAGYAYDAESGLCYCSARHYDPFTRQFISKDPVDADGEESAYQYCGGEPIARTDPSGRRWHYKKRLHFPTSSPVFYLDIYLKWFTFKNGKIKRGTVHLDIYPHPSGDEAGGGWEWHYDPKYYRSQYRCRRGNGYLRYFERHKLTVSNADKAAFDAATDVLMLLFGLPAGYHFGEPPPAWLTVKVFIYRTKARIKCGHLFINEA